MEEEKKIIRVLKIRLLEFIAFLQNLNKTNDLNIDKIKEIKSQYTNISKDYSNKKTKTKEMERLYFLMNLEYSESLKNFFEDEKNLKEIRENTSFLENLNLSKDLAETSKISFTDKMSKNWSQVYSRLSVISNKIRLDSQLLSKNFESKTKDDENDMKNVLFNKYIRNVYFYLKKIKLGISNGDVSNKFKSFISKTQQLVDFQNNIKDIGLNNPIFDEDNKSNLKEIQVILKEFQTDKNISNYDNLKQFSREFDEFIKFVLIQKQVETRVTDSKKHILTANLNKIEYSSGKFSGNENEKFENYETPPIYFNLTNNSLHDSSVHKNDFKSSQLEEDKNYNYVESFIFENNNQKVFYKDKSPKSDSNLFFESLSNSNVINKDLLISKQNSKIEERKSIERSSRLDEKTSSNNKEAHIFGEESDNDDGENNSPKIQVVLNSRNKEIDNGLNKANKKEEYSENLKTEAQEKTVQINDNDKQDPVNEGSLSVKSLKAKEHENINILISFKNPQEDIQSKNESNQNEINDEDFETEKMMKINSDAEEEENIFLKNVAKPEKEDQPNSNKNFIDKFFDKTTDLDGKTERKYESESSKTIVKQERKIESILAENPDMALKYDNLFAIFNQENRIPRSFYIEKFLDYNFPPIIYSLLNAGKIPKNDELILFKFRRISSIYSSKYFFNFTTPKLSFDSASLSNPKLLTLFLSFRKFEQFGEFFFVDYERENGKIILNNFTDDYKIEMDDFIPICLNNFSSADIDNFDFPFKSPIVSDEEIFFLFPILEKYCAKSFGSYENYQKADFKQTLRIFTLFVEEVDLVKIAEFQETQKTQFFADLKEDFLDPLRLIFVEQGGNSQESVFFIKNFEKDLITVENHLKETCLNFTNFLNAFHNLYIIEMNFDKKNHF